MYDRYITIYMPPGMDIWKQELSMLPYPYPELAKRTYITSSYDEFDNITKYHVLEKESFSFYQVHSAPEQWPRNNKLLQTTKQRRMGRKLRNNFPSGRPKKMSKGPVDHTKKWVELWLAALSPCRTPIGRLHVCYISQLLGDSFSVSQQPPICEFPSHSSLGRQQTWYGHLANRICAINT